jgi:hypothetical protein
MIRRGMRGSIPQNEQDSFALLYQDKELWEKLVEFSDANDAYVLLTDSTGKIRWRVHGKMPDRQTTIRLRDELAKMQH